MEAGVGLNFWEVRRLSRVAERLTLGQIRARSPNAADDRGDAGAALPEPSLAFDSRPKGTHVEDLDRRQVREMDRLDQHLVAFDGSSLAQAARSRNDGNRNHQTRCQVPMSVARRKPDITSRIGSRRDGAHRL